MPNVGVRLRLRLREPHSHQASGKPEGKSSVSLSGPNWPY
jgi:hypothetical protein